MTIKTDIKQQEKLEKFFKEENTWFPDNVGEKFLAIFFFIISGILACAPNKMIDFSDLNNDMKVVLIGYMFYLLGVTYMVMKYKSYQEAYSTNRKRITTRELLKKALQYLLMHTLPHTSLQSFYRFDTSYSLSDSWYRLLPYKNHMEFRCFF